MHTVADVMTKTPIMIRQNLSLQDTISVMDETKVSHLLVTDSNDKYIGIISRNDVLKKARAIMRGTTGKMYTNFELEKTKAKDILTPGTINLKPENCIEYASEILLQKLFHSLPVLEDEVPVGIVTTYDLLKYHYEVSEIRVK